MKKLIFTLIAAVFVNIASADTTHVSINIEKATTYKIVDRQTIYNIQDSLESDSLLEFRIDNISYSNLTNSKLDNILFSINNKICPTGIDRIATISSTHFSYDEENKKMYNGVTYVAISSAIGPDGTQVTDITIFWSNPKIVQR